MFLTWNIECWILLTWNVWICGFVLLTLFMPRSNNNTPESKLYVKTGLSQWETRPRGGSSVRHTPVRGHPVQNPNWQLDTLSLYASCIHSSSACIIISNQNLFHRVYIGRNIIFWITRSSSASQFGCIPVYTTWFDKVFNFLLKAWHTSQVMLEGYTKTLRKIICTKLSSILKQMSA